MTERLHIVIRGAVQGVGFRPFVFRLATGLGIRGWVRNSHEGVSIDAEADRPALDAFLLRIDRDKPAQASIHSLEFSVLDPAGYGSFQIRTSDAGGRPVAFVLPDIGTCPACRTELLDPTNRRYRYPFINCTNCGPRFSIIRALPYDRPNTTMSTFTMCDRCAEEYTDPRDRRFHAQPNACPACGPSLELWDAHGKVTATEDGALRQAVQLLRSGAIVAVKGIGGFHLMTSASNGDAVMRLRDRKRREEKPLALMFPDLEWVRRECVVGDLEERLLLSPEAPIVLLQKRQDGKSRPGSPPGSRPAPNVAPGNPALGVMLPYSPLHHLLLHDLGMPVVATSGNLSDEPICIQEHEALRRLEGIADAFLVHDRPIARHLDDSIVRVILGRELLLRRARGYAPLPVTIPTHVPDLLAVGAHLKSTVAVARDRHVFISQHLGDLETAESLNAFEQEMEGLQELFQIRPGRVVSDMHPDYLSTARARESGLHHSTFQHHYAHVASCMAENELEGTVLGVSWDGTGFGPDGTVWGGEFLLTTARSFRRVGTFRHFRLPGGDRATREPRRSAFGLLYQILGKELVGADDLPPVAAFPERDRSLLSRMLERSINAPETSSAGRLFDAAASIIGLRQECSFEGQAAMELEFAATTSGEDGVYPIALTAPDQKEPEQPIQIDWEPAFLGLIEDWKGGTTGDRIAAKFHNTLVQAILEIAKRIGEERVLLTGGCFQNRYLTERAVRELRRRGFRVYWHQRVPPNDGGISLGQIYALSRAAGKSSREPN